MKKIILGGLIAASVMFGANANEMKTLDLKSNYKNTKELMEDTKKNYSSYAEIITDYFQAKTCKEDFTKTVSMKEIVGFVNAYQFNVLAELKYKSQESILARTNYDALINAYKVMNCGSEDAMGTYVGAVSAMAVEMNANQAK